jgi:hypothetical protein
MSNAQLEKHIRKISVDSSTVILTEHAKERMALRKVQMSQVLDVLRRGTIVRPPEPGKTANSLVCRMERYVAGVDLAVCVAVDGDDPDLVVVTVIAAGRP